MDYPYRLCAFQKMIPDSPGFATVFPRLISWILLQSQAAGTDQLPSGITYGLWQWVLGYHRFFSGTKWRNVASHWVLIDCAGRYEGKKHWSRLLSNPSYSSYQDSSINLKFVNFLVFWQNLYLRISLPLLLFDWGAVSFRTVCFLFKLFSFRFLAFS